MGTPMNLDEFLSQCSGFTATLQPIPDKPTHVKVTPFKKDHGCGCASSFELPKEMIRSVTPTGKYHFCGSKRLEIAVVEFSENASIPVADLMKRKGHSCHHEHSAPSCDAGGCHDPAHATAHHSCHGHGAPSCDAGGCHDPAHATAHHSYHAHAAPSCGAGGCHDPAHATAHHSCHAHAAPSCGAGGGHMTAQAKDHSGQGIVGRWPIPWTPCEIVCAEVCTRFCGPTGWDCCQWETRCAINCNRLA